MSNETVFVVNGACAEYGKSNFLMLAISLNFEEPYFSLLLSSKPPFQCPEHTLDQSPLHPGLLCAPFAQVR